MSEIVTIFACPNGCFATFAAEAKVLQKWELDCEGDTIQMLQSDDPDLFDTIRCQNCGANAEEVNCRRYSVYKPDAENGNPNRQAGQLYIPVNDEKIVYYRAAGETRLERLPISFVGADASPSVVIEGQRFFITNEGVFMDTPLEGQVSLF